MKSFKKKLLWKCPCYLSQKSCIIQLRQHFSPVSRRERLFFQILYSYTCQPLELFIFLVKTKKQPASFSIFKPHAENILRCRQAAVGARRRRKRIRGHAGRGGQARRGPLKLATTTGHKTLSNINEATRPT